MIEHYEKYPSRNNGARFIKVIFTVIPMSFENLCRKLNEKMFIVNLFKAISNSEIRKNRVLMLMGKRLMFVGLNNSTEHLTLQKGQKGQTYTLNLNI